MIQIVFIFILIWTIISFIDVIFKTCMFCPYIKTLDTYGITIKPCYLHCYITRFNRSLKKWSHFKPNLLRKWYDLGTFITCSCILPAIGLLFISAVKILSIKEKADFGDQLLIPVVPGLNLPLSHLFYYFLILSLCSIVHEMGHAIAAGRENVSILGCGFFILGVLPAAFVDIHKEQLMHLSVWQRLRVFSAGIWHNVILAIVALLLLLSNSILLAPFYLQGQGISVVHVNEYSGAAGPAGLFQGDHILSINNCNVPDVQGWYSCLKGLISQPQSGYCANKDFILLEDAPIGLSEDCCNNSSTHICFKDTDNQINKRYCLPVRQLLKHSKRCQDSKDCGNINQYSCVTPILFSETDRLIEINRKKHNPVLFYGSLAELFASVTVSPWIARLKFIPIYLVEFYETFLKYLFSFSGALALLNLIPCPGLDGQHLFETLGHALLFKTFPKSSHRNLIILIVKSFGCLLICLNIIFGIYKLYIT